MPRVHANGINIHYEQRGRGPDILLVHGGASNLAFWYLRVVPLLSADFRLTVYDLRGHGLSDMPPSGYSTRDFADDLSDLIDALGLELVHLVGHSLGGAISLHFAAHHPRRVRSLSLMDARVHALQPLHDPEDSAYWNRQREVLQKKGIAIPDDAPRIVYRVLDELSGLEHGRFVSNGIWDANTRAARRWRALVTETSFPTDLRSDGGLTPEAIRRVTLPTLLAYGDQSHCLPTCRRLETLLPAHRTVVHADMGHFFPLIAPAVAADDIRSFVHEVAAASPTERERASIGTEAGNPADPTTAATEFGYGT